MCIANLSFSFLHLLHFTLVHTGLWSPTGDEAKMIFEETSCGLTAAYGLLRARESNAGLLQNSFPSGGEFCLWPLASFVDVRAVCPVTRAVFPYMAWCLPPVLSLSTVLCMCSLIEWLCDICWLCHSQVQGWAASPELLSRQAVKCMFFCIPSEENNGAHAGLKYLLWIHA